MYLTAKTPGSPHIFAENNKSFPRCVCPWAGVGGCHSRKVGGRPPTFSPCVTVSRVGQSQDLGIDTPSPTPPINGWWQKTHPHRRDYPTAYPPPTR